MGGTGGSGGFGRGDGDDEERPQPPKRVLWQGWADRVAADPQFTYKVLIEQVRGRAVLVLAGRAGGAVVLERQPPYTPPHTHKLCS